MIAIHLALAADRALTRAGSTHTPLVPCRVLVLALEMADEDVRAMPVRLPAVCEVRREPRRRRTRRR